MVRGTFGSQETSRVRRSQVRRILGLVAVLLAASAAIAQAQSRIGHRSAQTTVPTPYETVNVTMTDTRFTLSTHSGPMGWDARFVIHNTGTKPHALGFRGLEPSAAVSSTINAVVQPRQQKIVIVYLNRVGAKLRYFGSLPADRNKSGMQGVFSIGACVNLTGQNQAYGGYQLCTQVGG
jgi:hypothetical protein